MGMDIEKINSVLQRAIVGFQESEIDGMTEAVAGSGAHAYEVPSPWSIGVKPKSSKLKGWSSKNFEVVISAKVPWESDTKETIKASVKGGWAVHRSTIGARRGWVVTHIPSGQVVEFYGYDGTFHRRKKDAQQLVERWIEAVPELLKASTPGVIRKHLRTMQDIATGKVRQKSQEPKVVEPAVVVSKDPRMDLLKSNIVKAMKGGQWMMTNHVERKVIRDDKRLKGEISATEFVNALYALKKEGKVKDASMDGDLVWRLV